MTERIFTESLCQKSDGAVTVVTCFYVEDVDGEPLGMLLTEQPYIDTTPWPGEDS